MPSPAEPRDRSGRDTPRARSMAEADLYVSMQPCPNCASTGQTVQGSTVETVATVDGEQVWLLTARCPQCAEFHEYRFRFPAEPATPVDGHQRFGGDEPSELFDAGQWLLVADAMLEDVPEHPGELAPARRRALRDRVDVAVAAVEEALKFLPEGGNAVSPFAFWSEPGYRLFSSQPWMFERDELASLLAEYQRILSRYLD
jgi:hypothetical protein